MKAITFNLLAWVMLPIMDGFAKYLSAELPVLQITWARYFFTVAFTLPIMFFFFRENLVWTDKPKLQFIRGLILLTANICFFYAISVISLAKALTLAFVAPLIVTAFSPIFLGERVGFRRWSAVIIGFIENTTFLLMYATIFLILMSLGIALTRLKVFSLNKAIFSSLGRVIVGPIIGYLLILYFGLEGFAAGVLLIQCSMPSAVLNYLVASIYSPKKIVDSVASTIVVSTLMSFITCLLYTSPSPRDRG